MGVYGLLARTRGSRSVQLGPHGSTEGPDEPEQDDRQGGKRSDEVARGGAEGGRSNRPFRDTRRAAPRPDMARAVSTARASIAAVSDPFATEVDHGGVTESPLGLVLLCGAQQTESRRRARQASLRASSSLQETALQGALQAYSLQGAARDTLRFHHKYRCGSPCLSLPARVIAARISARVWRGATLMALA